MRVAIYARVSTDDKDQDPENQLMQLREWCNRAGHTIVNEYVEHKSGTKSADKRNSLASMLEDAHRRKFDLLLCWALDRLTREGMLPTLRYLQRLADVGVGFVSYTEPHLSTDNEIVRNVLLALASSFAKLEVQKMSARTRAGLERAVAKGKVLGRPKIGADKEEAIRDALRCGGKGMLKIAAELGVGSGTVQRIAAEMKA